MTKLQPGEKLYTGAIVSPSFADTYNALTDRIEAFRQEGREPPESLLNGRHNVFDAYARINAVKQI